MAELPKFVYLIISSSEWAVTAIADDHPSTPERIEAEVSRRSQKGGKVRIWRVPTTEAAEMELQPAVTVPPSVREKR